MKQFYENLTVYQNEKDDWTMKQIKRKQYEDIENIPKTFEEKIAASMKPAMDYLDEVIRGHERHLKLQAEKKEKEKIAEIQRLSGTVKE